MGITKYVIRGSGIVLPHAQNAQRCSLELKCLIFQSCIFIFFRCSWSAQPMALAQGVHLTGDGKLWLQSSVSQPIVKVCCDVNLFI